MPVKRVNPNQIKTHRSYTAGELAARLGVHKNTALNWQGKGLAALGDGRPVLFHGSTVRAFLTERNARRKRPCPPGAFYCLTCREHRPPALGMVDYVDRIGGAGNLSARAPRDPIPEIMPGLQVNIREASPRLTGGAHG